MKSAKAASCPAWPIRLSDVVLRWRPDLPAAAYKITGGLRHMALSNNCARMGRWILCIVSSPLSAWHPSWKLARPLMNSKNSRRSCARAARASRYGAQDTSTPEVQRVSAADGEHRRGRSAGAGGRIFWRHSRAGAHRHAADPALHAHAAVASGMGRAAAPEAADKSAWSSCRLSIRAACGRTRAATRRRGPDAQRAAAGRGPRAFPGRRPEPERRPALVSRPAGDAHGNRKHGPAAGGARAARRPALQPGAGLPFGLRFQRQPVVSVCQDAPSDAAPARDVRAQDHAGAVLPAPRLQLRAAKQPVPAARRPVGPRL